jgi:hypothetical protein
MPSGSRSARSCPRSERAPPGIHVNESLPRTTVRLRSARRSSTSAGARASIRWRSSSTSASRGGSSTRVATTCCSPAPRSARGASNHARRLRGTSSSRARSGRRSSRPSRCARGVVSRATPDRTRPARGERVSPRVRAGPPPCLCRDSGALWRHTSALSNVGKAYRLSANSPIQGPLGVAYRLLCAGRCTASVASSPS